MTQEEIPMTWDPIPMTQEENVKEPKIDEVHWTQAPAEMVVEVPLPMIQDENVHAQDELFHAVSLGIPAPRAP